MAESEPTCELHLRLVGQASDLMLRVHGKVPADEEVASWMQDGSVIRLEVSETGSRAPHAILVNFGRVVFAWLTPYRSGRSVNL
jgi:hypothetical protein